MKTTPEDRENAAKFFNHGRVLRRDRAWIDTGKTQRVHDYTEYQKLALHFAWVRYQQTCAIAQFVESLYKLRVPMPTVREIAHRIMLEFKALEA